MSSKIWVASRPVIPEATESYVGDAAGLIGEHTYLVYDPDGDPTTGDELVWRAGPEDFPIPTGNIEIENWVPIEDSIDNHNAAGLDPFGDRNFTELDTGSKTPEQVMSDIDQYSNSLGQEDSNGKILTDFPYEILGTNSNSAVNSALNSADIDMHEKNPDGTYKNLPEDFQSRDFPGSDALLDSPSNDEHNVESGRRVTIADGGGDDIIRVEKGGQVNVINDKDQTSSDTVVVEGYDAEDATIARKADDLIIILNDGNGNITLIRLSGYFNENGLGNTILDFDPDGNGDGGNGDPIDLNDPSNYSSYPVVVSILGAAIGLNNWIADVADYFGLAEWFGSPLVLDLDGDGIELVSIENSNMMWDIDEDGFAEATGWITADDGFLAIDLDSSGDINSHAELFGSITQDGFSVLAAYDTNIDGSIDTSDTQFGDLLVWQDINQNGISESTELFSLADLDIVSIDLNASTPSGLTNEGHSISHVSSYTVDDGVSGPQTLEIVDVWFNYDNTITNYVGDYELDLGSLFTVNLRGYGNLPSLQVAASLDNDILDSNSLMSLLTIFTLTSFDNLFVDDRSVMNNVQDIMFRWAGVDTLDPTSRGDYVDARKLEFLEKLLGDDYLQGGWNANPGAGGSSAVHRAYEVALYPIVARLTAQAVASELFEGAVFYNPVIDTFEGFTGFNQGALDSLLAKSLDGTQVADKMNYWLNIVNVIDNSIGMANVPAAEFTALENTIIASDDSLNIQMLLDKRAMNIEDEVLNVSNGDTITGTNGDDVYTGSIGDDYYNGTYGNDTLSGGIGDDILYGSNGNDILDGQLGNDTLYGQWGVDTYLYTISQGDDHIIETSSDVDSIVFSAGLTASDILISRIAGSDLYLQIDPSAGAGSITIDGYVELLEFSDSTVLDIRTMDMVTNGTSGNDTLRGVRMGEGGTGIDTIYGHDGDDLIYGNAANQAEYNANYMYGGAGNDELRGSRGNDTYVMGSGDDLAVENGRGDDTFIYTSGLDHIFEYTTVASDDLLVLDVASTINDIAFSRSGNNATIVIDSGVDEIFVQSLFASWRYNIETVEFGDGFSTNLLTFQSWQYGTSSADTINGTSSADTLIGQAGDDVLYGLAGDDDIHGGSDSDALYGGDGADKLWGGSEGDTFVFESASAFNDIDIVGDFDQTEGDAINLSDLLSAYDPLSDAITDFVQITDDGTDSFLAVDANGGADSFVQIATLSGVIGLTDEAALETSGNLIAA